MNPKLVVAINIREIRKRISHLIWKEPDQSNQKAWNKRVIHWLRIGYMVVRNLADGQLTLRAMSLVYTTLLSLVPLLALSFSALKAFGVHNQFEPILLDFLKPLGPKSVELTTRTIGFVDNMRVGVLGTLGLGFLIYTVIAMMQKIEGSFNYVWHVTQNRSFAQRFSDYLSVLIIGPVLVFSALGVTASIMSTPIVQTLAAIEPFGTLIAWITKLVPYLMIIGAFTFIFGFIPNTKVKLGSAMAGALIAGIAWQSTGWGFAFFIANSTNYTAIYSALASLVMFMIWLYLSWLILLVGASIAFYHQHPEYLITAERQFQPSNYVREWLALTVVHYIGHRYYQRQPPYTLEELSQALRFPAHVLESIFSKLENHGLLSTTADNPPRLLPAQPFDTTLLIDLIQAVRKSSEDDQLTHQAGGRNAIVFDLLQGVEHTMASELDGYTLKDLALSTTSPLGSTSPEKSSSSVARIKPNLD